MHSKSGERCYLTHVSVWLPKILKKAQHFPPLSQNSQIPELSIHSA